MIMVQYKARRCRNHSSTAAQAHPDPEPLENVKQRAPVVLKKNVFFGPEPEGRLLSVPFLLFTSRFSQSSWLSYLGAQLFSPKTRHHRAEIGPMWI